MECLADTWKHWPGTQVKGWLERSDATGILEKGNVVPEITEEHSLRKSGQY